MAPSRHFLFRIQIFTSYLFYEPPLLKQSRFTNGICHSSYARGTIKRPLLAFTFPCVCFHHADDAGRRSIFKIPPPPFLPFQPCSGPLDSSSNLEISTFSFAAIHVVRQAVVLPKLTG